MAKKPRKYNEKLASLKELSRSLNTRMEDGSFYEQSFWVRYREIQKIKRLYNQLRGPLSEGALQHAVSFASVLLLITGLGCSDSRDDMASVSLKINVGAKNNDLTRSVVSRDAAPSTITSISLTVTGNGMADINKTIPLETGSVSLYVPAGSGRTFQVRAETGYQAYLSGSAVVDLRPGAVTDVPVSMEIYGMPVLNTTGTNNPFGLSGIGNPAFLSFADLDADGDLDLMITSRYSLRELNFYENNGGTFGAFSPAISYETTFSDYYGYRQFADLDNDGDYDVLAVIGTSLYHFENTGTATSASFPDGYLTTPISNLTISYEGLVTVGDIDNDGDLDIFTGMYSSFYTGGSTENLRFFQNIGTATSCNFGTVATGPFGLSSINSVEYVISPTLVDIDNDGDLDLFIGIGYFSGLHYAKTFLAENTGTASSPNFSSALQEDPFGIDADLNSFTFAMPAFADIDDDGDLDLFVGLKTGDIRYYENIIIP